MNDSKDNPKKQQETPMSQEDLDRFTNDIVKKISTMNKKSRRRVFSLNINPFIIIISVFVLIFISYGFLFSGTTLNKIALSEAISGLKDDRFSQVYIQSEGSIALREKTLLVTKDDVNVTSGDVGKITKISDNSVEKITVSQFADLLKSGSLIDRIRNLFRGGSTKIQSVLVLEDSIFVSTDKTSKDLIIENTSEEAFTEYLESNGVYLSQQGIPLKRLEKHSKAVSGTVVSDYSKRRVLSSLVDFGDYAVGFINEDSVQTYLLDWTPSIYSFADILIQQKIDLDSKNFEIIAQNVSGGITLDTVLTVLTIVGFVFLGIVIFRSVQSSGMGIMQFGQSKAKMFFGQKTGITFADVAGIDEAREELNEIVDFLRNPNKYRKLGARIPKGILMFGAPGTGKTLLARAIAGEAGVPFFHTSGSEFEEMLVGAGASRVRDLFAKAKKAAPALIFIDEIDAVARKRGTRIQSGTTEQTLNQILVEMDGFENNTNVIVIAATNRPDVLDPAILRPGRFDRQVRIETPDKDGRVSILKIHSKNKPLAADVDLDKVAKRTVGFSGADLENIMNEAAIIAAKADRKEISLNDIDEAVSKVVLGPAKKSRKRTDDELNLVAYHEAGHAIVSKFTDKAVPVDKISIVSRGSSGGVTMFLPENDENIISMRRLIANIRVSLGGRAAEEIILGDISTGASSDIEQATRVAKNMIQKYGMSKDLGMVQYGQATDSEFLGYNYGESKDFSEQTAEMIDKEVRDIMAEQYKEAKKILMSKKHILDKLAKTLIEKEVMEKDEFDKLIEDNDKK